MAVGRPFLFCIERALILTCCYRYTAEGRRQRRIHQKRLRLKQLREEKIARLVAIADQQLQDDEKPVEMVSSDQNAQKSTLIQSDQTLLSPNSRTVQIALDNNQNSTSSLSHQQLQSDQNWLSTRLSSIYTATINRRNPLPIENVVVLPPSTTGIAFLY